ncbi:MAG: hypothetical protein R2729_24810 [Bryobacteraceae bacterium]
MPLPALRALALVLLYAVAGAVCVDAGEVTGTIHVTRALTRKRVPIVARAYQRGMAPAVASAAGDWTELSRLAVYLDDGKVARTASGATLSLTQKGRRFEPEVAVIRAGNSVEFPNFDPIVHNVFSLSKAKSFDLGYYPKGQTRSVRFDDPGIVSVYCHLHPNMSAAIVVAPGPWVARPDLAGDFAIPDVPEGRYTLVVWHKSAGFFRRRITVERDGAVHADIEIPVRAEPEAAGE